MTTAYETPSDFAFAFPRLESLDTVLRDLDENTIQALNLPAGMELLSSLPAARLRKALKICQDATIHAPSESLTPKTPTPVRSLDSLPPSHEWAEHIPPKLTPETVDSLVKVFKQNYPGELLDADSMPSIRLLSLVHEGLKTRLRWIPWQFRLSQRQYQEIQEAKTSRVVRSEVQLITSAFLDDQPEVSVENRPLSAGWLLHIQTVFRNALALCNAAHLKSCRPLPQAARPQCGPQDSHYSRAPSCGPQVMEYH